MRNAFFPLPSQLTAGRTRMSHLIASLPPIESGTVMWVSCGCLSGAVLAIASILIN
jgi:hypothetical protein